MLNEGTLADVAVLVYFTYLGLNLPQQGSFDGGCHSVHGRIARGWPPGQDSQGPLPTLYPYPLPCRESPWREEASVLGSTAGGQHGLRR